MTLDQAQRRSGRLASGGICLRLGYVLLAVLGLLLSFAPAQAIDRKPLVGPVSTTPPAGTKVNVEADVFTYDEKTKVSTASGKVHMTYGPYTLDANHVKVNQQTGEYWADGSIVIHEPNGNVLEANTLDMKNKFRDGLLTHVKALLTNDAMIMADRLRRVDGSTFIYEKAHYTVCKTCRTSNGDPLWEIVADKTVHDTVHHNLYHTNPRFKIDGVTVFGLPYYAMPDPSVTRRSGFLAPQVTFANGYGAGVQTPYFWAIDPSTDLTLSPIFSIKQGPIADTEFRHASENGSMTADAYGVYQFTPMAYPDDQTWRGAFKTAGNYSAGEDWTWGWSGTVNTDRSFLYDYNFDTRSYAMNGVYATKVDDQDYFSAQMLNFGSLDTSLNPDNLPYAMPFITGETIMRDTPIGGQFDFTYNAYSIHRNAAWVPFNTSTVEQGTDQTRATTNLNWHQAMYSPIGTVVTPFANVRGDILVSQNVPDANVAGTFHSETTARVLPEVGVDARYPFVADTGWGQSVISPVAQIVASANEGDTSAFGNEDSVTVNYDHTSLFLANRFNGFDRYEGGTHADVGMTYSLFARNGGFIRASAGQSFHIAGQNSFVDGSGLADNESDLVGAVVFQPWSILSLSYEARAADDFSVIHRQEVAASLNFDRFAASVSYLDFLAEPNYGLVTDQHTVQADGKVRLNNGWSVFAGMTYDIYNSVFTRRTAGLEFDCNCMNFKLYYNSTQDATTRATDDTIMMSVEFATLGKTGIAAGL